MACSFTLSRKPLLENASDAYALLATSDTALESQIAPFEKLFPALVAYCAQQKFTAKTGTLIHIPVAQKNTIKHLIVAGLGDNHDSLAVCMEHYRRAIAHIVRIMQNNKITSVTLALPKTSWCSSDERLAHETAVSALMAHYTFDTFKTDQKNADLTITLAYARHDAKKLATGITRGVIVGNAVNNAREWVNMPANMLTPEDLAAQTKQLCAAHDLTCTVFDEKKIEQLGMGGLLAVARGSARKPRFVTIEYRCANKKAPTLCFVGKGITFDSGGLSLKPASGMETMKDDMAGASAVINTMIALAQLKPVVNIIALTPLTENMPGSNASKPGDIVHVYNGKTVEIKNTDAEGRLILAGALAYAVKHHPSDALIDLATLTGACLRAVGPFFSGLLSTNEDLVTKIQKAADISGDTVWRLPLTQDYQKAVESCAADVCNISKTQYLSGATTAAVFLQHFVDGAIWAHIDLAAAFDVPDLPYYRSEHATGAGVRLLVQLAMNWQN